jgi:PIN domain nuclease of toxin-antitoxin system
MAAQVLDIGFELLKLKDEHIFSYQYLPVFAGRRDPFDRFLIAIAKQENFPIVTTDIKFKLYSSLIQIVD